MTDTLIFATRPSLLARWQTQHVIRLLKVRCPKLSCQELVITTQGDRSLDLPLPQIGGKGLFTYELEQALLQGNADAAVHSLKDLPVEDSPGLIVPVIPQREDCHDAWVCPAGFQLDELPSGSIVGTSSLRRQAQLLAWRPDLKVESIRGNVDTRLRKVLEGRYDAIILAAAGLIRLGLGKHITHHIPFEFMLPAPGQGALAIQCRAGDQEVQDRLFAIHHQPTSLAVAAERAFLSALGGGCSLPVGALAVMKDGEIELQGVIAALDGRKVIRLGGVHHDPHFLGQKLADQALSEGAADLISSLPEKG
jgi:hydroxymethylbilane synthase